MTIYERLGASPVINASGRLTSLGGSALSSAVQQTMVEASQVYVDMQDLKRRAGRRIAELCGAEAAYPTVGASAGVIIMVAAAVAGTSRARVLALPDPDWEQSEIVIQAGHLIDYGAPIRQAIRMGGGRPVAVGSVNLVTEDELLAALGPRTAAILYVQSHHTPRRGLLSFKRVTEVAGGRGVPVLIDAAAEEDVRIWYAEGGDLVAYSGSKAVEGPTAGFILGRAGLIESCFAQEQGVARPMKASKEAIAGLVVALENYVLRDTAAESRRRIHVRDELMAGLASIPGLGLRVENDEAGRDIPRVAMIVLPDAPFGLADLVDELKRGSPPVFVRAHHLGEGYVTFDPRCLLPDHPAMIVAQVRAAVRSCSTNLTAARG